VISFDFYCHKNNGNGLLQLQLHRNLQRVSTAYVLHQNAIFEQLMLLDQLQVKGLTMAGKSAYTLLVTTLCTVILAPILSSKDVCVKNKTLREYSDK
jgi:ABC-type cobalamin transport system ATPase subunit